MAGNLARISASSDNIIELDRVRPGRSGRASADRNLCPDLCPDFSESRTPRKVKKSGKKELTPALIDDLRVGKLDDSKTGALSIEVLKALAFVDTFEVERQRWVWRNLPNVSPSNALGEEARLSSGLPSALSGSSQTLRDNDPSVLVFDARAAIDNCFTNRTTARDRWPRDKVNRPAADAVLLVDDRDAQTAADYLRYTLKVVSRYDALYGPGKIVQRAEPAGDVPGHPALNKVRASWRRIASAYRGKAELRPLNILALLPLTTQPLIDPATGNPTVPDPNAGTPFLVILDEIWFREYGPGEALRAELALEDREIGDVDDEGVATPRPLRYGPLPHKHNKARTGTDTFLDEEVETERDVRCTCFGPFGFSLDRSGNEALANATAFLVYLPKKYAEIGPHWGVAVRFRRVLHSLTSGAAATETAGPVSGPHLLYTLADSGCLARIEADGQALIAPDATLQGRGVTFDLAPYRRDNNLPDQKVLARHLYAMLVGRAAYDGGRGVEIFLPEVVVRIDQGRLVKLNGQPLAALPGGNRAQVLEIELDGAAGDELEKDLDLRAFFKALLPSESEPADTPGRILRISAVFPLAAST